MRPVRVCSERAGPEQCPGVVANVATQRGTGSNARGGSAQGRIQALRGIAEVSGDIRGVSSITVAVQRRQYATLGLLCVVRGDIVSVERVWGWDAKV